MRLSLQELRRWETRTISSSRIAKFDADSCREEGAGGWMEGRTILKKDRGSESNVVDSINAWSVPGTPPMLLGRSSSRQLDWPQVRRGKYFVPRYCVMIDPVDPHGPETFGSTCLAKPDSDSHADLGWRYDSGLLGQEGLHQDISKVAYYYAVCWLIVCQSSASWDGPAMRLLETCPASVGCQSVSYRPVP